MNKILLRVILAGLVFYSTSLAADSTATVVASRGEVTVEGVDISSGSPISVGDTVTTGTDSFVVLQFVDGTKVTIRPNSQLVVEEYVFSGGDQDAATLNLVKGGLRIITGALAKVQPDNYRLKTPVALMGVRGTEFAVMLCEDRICEIEAIGD